MTDDESLRAVYEALRAVAARKLALEPASQSLSPTGLVHEAWLRLASASVDWNDETHFFRLAARAMRRILVDRARARLADKRGGNQARQQLGDIPIPETDEHLLVLDEALIRLAEAKPDHARLVELRFFAGLTGDEAASALGVSAATADRMWRFARSWLQVQITDDL